MITTQYTAPKQRKIQFNFLSIDTRRSSITIKDPNSDANITQYTRATEKKMMNDTPQNPVLSQVISIIKAGIAEYSAQKRVDDSHQPTVPLNEANYDTLAHTIVVPVEFSDVLSDIDTFCSAVKRHLVMAGYANNTIALDTTTETRVMVFVTVPTTTSGIHGRKPGVFYIKNQPTITPHSQCSCSKCLCWTLVPAILGTIVIAGIGMVH